MNNPEMKPVPGHEDRYFVTKYGRVFSNFTGKLKEKTRYTIAGGCYKILLTKNGKVFCTNVSRLVYMAWKNPDIPDGAYIDYLDGNNANNHVDNLICVTPQKNSDYKKLHGTMVKGENNGRAKLSKEDVKEIRKRYFKEKVSQGALAREYGVGRSTIWRVINYKTWKNI